MLLSLAAPHSALLAQTTMGDSGAPAVVYTNPVLPHADPSILKWNGEYYLYATGNPIRAYHSTDLVHWTEIGPVLWGSEEPYAWNQTDVWAPEVIYRNGTFYMYYTASKASPDWRVGEMARRIGVATSESPAGPFVDSGEPLTPGWGIDGHVFRDPDSGKDYLFYSYLYDPRLPGAGLVVDSMPDPMRVGGRPSHVTRGSEWWEDKDADPQNGSLRYTNEGPTVLKKDGTYYLIYSGGSWDLPTYALAYAVSDRVMEGGLDGPGWTKVMPPILRSTPLVEAPGHNSVVKAPNNVDDITAYHARVVPFTGPGDRQTFVDRLYWNHERLYMQPPSTGGLPTPDLPLFRDLFDREGGLGSGWEVANGSWRIESAEASGSGTALIATEPLQHYLLEANVRLPARGGEAGVVAFRNGDDVVEVLLDAERRALRLAGRVGGEAVEGTSVPVEEGFRFDVYHQLLVTKNAHRLQVELDGVRVASLELEALDAAGRVGLLARGGRAYFDGIALTSWFRDAFDQPDDTWEISGGSWMVDEGALHQGAGGADRYVALKGEPAENYEFSASVRWRDEESSRSTAGIVAAATASGDLVLAGFDHEIWPFGRFHVRHVVNGQVVHSLSVETPRGFLFNVFHTISVTKQGEAFTFTLDGREIVAVRFPVGEARAGLYTEGVRAAFDDASLKRIVVPRNRVLNGSFEAERWPEEGNAAANPWRLTGGAMVNFCCAHSGLYRLLLRQPESVAEQTVRGLEPGSYTLWAWVTTRDAEGEVVVSPAGGAPVQQSVAGEGWHRVLVEFEVPPGSGEVTLRFSGRFEGNAPLVAVDDVYLFERGS
ncbi:MAG TPA: glycoside hydrolase family 43 protein [Longimicrobiaceae bacterium]